MNNSPNTAFIPKEKVIPHIKEALQAEIDQILGEGQIILNIEWNEDGLTLWTNPKKE